MTTPPRPADYGRDADGVRVERRGAGALWLIALALAVPVVLTVAAVVFIRRTPGLEARAPGPAVAADVETEPAVASVASAPAVPTAMRSPERVVPRRVAVPLVEDAAGSAVTATPAPEKPRREIDAADAIVALREEGIHDGIAAFGIPGSHPPKAGIVVPEEFELPEGYVRHYQSTDDGEQLPAILMFHPDYEFVNEAGEVVKLPEDGVVRPEMAPPGIDTKQVLVVPERKGGEPIR
jgi:hypothetical protein